MQLTLGLSWAARSCVFGRAHDDAPPALTIVAVAAVPMVVKNHFHVHLRIRGRPARAAIVCAVGGLLELGAAALGLARWGLPDLATGWLVAVVVKAAVMAIPVARTAFGANHASPGPEAAAQSVWPSAGRASAKHDTHAGRPS